MTDGLSPTMTKGERAGWRAADAKPGAEAIGPLLLGIAKPVVVSYQAASVQTLVNLAAIAVAGLRR